MMHLATLILLGVLALRQSFVSALHARAEHPQSSKSIKKAIKHPKEFVHVVVISDRPEALLGSLGSVILHTTVPTILHIITQNQQLETRLQVLKKQWETMPDEDDETPIVQMDFISFASVLNDLASQGVIPVWKWPEFGSSIRNRESWVWNHTVRVDSWDNLTIHSNPMNLLRFYLPKLKQFRQLKSLIFMDDDIIVQGDLRDLQQVQPAEGFVQLATCELWRWRKKNGTNPEGFYLYDSTPLDETDLFYLKRKQQPKQYPVALKNAIAQLNRGQPDLHSHKYWNYGFVKIDLEAWRHKDLTGSFERWMHKNYEEHIFPEYALSYGLGIPILSLLGKVQCWTEANVTITDGLGYVSAPELLRSGVDSETLDSSFVLHWAGGEKPFVPGSKAARRDKWNNVLLTLGVPRV